MDKGLGPHNFTLENKSELGEKLGSFAKEPSGELQINP
jgi:hypothetical protein